MDGDRPRVTPTEWREKVRPALANDGFSEKQRDKLEVIFNHSLVQDPTRSSWKPGIDEPTLTKTIEYLRENKDASSFSGEQLDRIEAIIKRYITLRS